MITAVCAQPGEQYPKSRSNPTILPTSPPDVAFCFQCSRRLIGRLFSFCKHSHVAQMFHSSIVLKNVSPPFYPFIHTFHAHFLLVGNILITSSTLSQYDYSHLCFFFSRSFSFSLFKTSFCFLPFCFCLLPACGCFGFCVLFPCFNAGSCCTKHILR